MRRSKVEVYLHFVWTTHQRQPVIMADIEQQVYAAILTEAKRCNVEVLAIGGIEDHIHLVVRKPATISEAQLMQRVKGVSSTFIREQVVAPGETFHWQENYAVFSFHAAHADRVISYVQNQKQHHADYRLRAAWEETDEEVPRNPTAPYINN